MAILIKDPETDRIVRRLAAKTGETLTEAVKIAAEQRLAAVAPKKRSIDMSKIREMLAIVDAMPVADDRAADDIIGYDESGLPN